jgi:hypothetical protein
MKIDNYSIATNSQYFRVDFNQTSASLQSDSNIESSTDSDKIDNIQIDEASKYEANDSISKDLSKAVLKNINNLSRRTFADNVELIQTTAESESVSFQAKAILQTKDKEMEISLDVSLSRSFVQQTSVSISAADFIDPLIISLDNSMPSLSSKKFSFDIDSDGKSDQISQLDKNSGFLALDKNGNSKIDNGLELFGTKSGDGFADLSVYDDDGNGWIDKNDSIFDKLRIWQKNENDSILLGLGEVGIGAIYLGDTATPFSIKSEDNQTLGEMKSSSMVVYEDGHAGVISQIDFAIEDETKKNIEKFKLSLENVSNLKVENLYQNQDNGIDKDFSEDKLEDLKKELAKLEAKLNNSTTENERKSIEAKIVSINSQIMTLIGTSE